MRSAVGLKAHHVVGCYSAPEYGIVPVLQHEKLIVVQHVGGACDIAPDEDAVGHHSVDVKDAAARIAGNAPKATCKASTPDANPNLIVAFSGGNKLVYSIQGYGKNPT
jgi:hypothetical protein